MTSNNGSDISLTPSTGPALFQQALFNSTYHYHDVLDSFFLFFVGHGVIRWLSITLSTTKKSKQETKRTPALLLEWRELKIVEQNVLRR